jgi:hypothetical protein
VVTSRYDARNRQTVARLQLTSTTSERGAGFDLAPLVHERSRARDQLGDLSRGDSVLLRRTRHGRRLDRFAAFGLVGKLLIRRGELPVASSRRLQIACQALKLLGTISKQHRSWRLCRHGLRPLNSESSRTASAQAREHQSAANHQAMQDAAREASAAQPRPSCSLDCSNKGNCRSAAATNAAQHILDSLLSRNLLRLKLIPFRRAPLRPWPDLARSSDRARDVAQVVASSGLDSSWRNRIFWRVAVLDRLLSKFGMNCVVPR